MIFGTVKPLNELLKHPELDSDTKEIIKDLKKDIMFKEATVVVGAAGVGAFASFLNHWGGQPMFFDIVQAGLYALGGVACLRAYQNETNNSHHQNIELRDKLRASYPNLATIYEANPAIALPEERPTAVSAPRKVGR